MLQETTPLNAETDNNAVPKANKQHLFGQAPGATDVWATPQDFFNKVNAVFDFKLDVCALPENAKCAHYFTPEDDGLAQDWTAQDFLLLLRQLAVVQLSGKVLVTFGPGDRQLQNSVKELLTPADRISILLAEQYPIERWGALLSCCNVVISPDTGSLHLAVALGRPVIAMYESDSFSHCSSQWAPWQVPAAIVRRSAPVVTVPIFIAETARLLHETGACTK